MAPDCKVTVGNEQANVTFDQLRNVTGYEIKRNGEVIMFTTSNAFTDVIGAMNNRAITYEITDAHKQLNTTNTVFRGSKNSK